MTSPFRIHIADLSQTGDSRDVVVTGPADGWGVELSSVPAGAEASGKFTLTAVGSGVVVRGSVAVSVHNTCYRCLESWDDTVEVDISQMFGDDTLEGVDYAVDGDEIDLEPLLRDELTLAMPLQPSDGCDELGGDDASDQNAPPQRGESPFAVLKDFLDGES